MLDTLQELAKELEAASEPDELEFVCAQIHAILNRLYGEPRKVVVTRAKAAQTKG